MARVGDSGRRGAGMIRGGRMHFAGVRVGALVACVSTGIAAESGKSTAPEVASGSRHEIFSLVVAPWTIENPRSDHAQIFPLSEGRLMLVWSEYYVRQPSRIFRNPYSPDGNADQAPCQLTAKVSRDGGRSWSGRFTLQENIGADNVKK